MASPVPSSSAAPPSSSSQAIVGSILLEKYLVIRNIGAGNFGCCWLVHDTTDNDALRAVKQVYVGTAVSAKDASRAESEAHLLSQLRHPHIVTFYECSVTGGFLSIVTEYCNGGDLAHVIALRNDPEQRNTAELMNAVPRHFSEAQVVSWLVQLTLALEYMHSKRILHRDVKSGNVFLRNVNDRNMIKLGDFGIAKALSGTLDNATSIAGTPYYMSPECIQGKGYNAKSDIWALGMIAYELCLLQHPFKGQSLMGLMYKICEEKFDIEIPDVYSADLARVIAQLFDRDPTRRPSATQILRLPYVKQCILDTVDGGETSSAKNRISLTSTPEVLANSMQRGSQKHLPRAHVRTTLDNPPGGSQDATRAIDNIRKGRRQKILKMKQSRLAATAHLTATAKPTLDGYRIDGSSMSQGSKKRTPATVIKSDKAAVKPAVEKAQLQLDRSNSAGITSAVQTGSPLDTVVVEGSTIGLSPRARLRLKKQQEADRRARELAQLAEAQADENLRRYTAEKHRLHGSDWSPAPSTAESNSAHLRSALATPTQPHAPHGTDNTESPHRESKRPGPISYSAGDAGWNGDGVHDRCVPQLRDVASPGSANVERTTKMLCPGLAPSAVAPGSAVLITRNLSDDTVNQMTAQFTRRDAEHRQQDASDASLDSGSGCEGSMWGDSEEEGGSSGGYSDDQFEEYADTDDSEVDSDSEDEFISCLQDALSLSRSGSADPVGGSWSSNEALGDTTADQTTVRDPFDMGVDMTDLDNITQTFASDSQPLANVTQPFDAVTQTLSSIPEPTPDDPIPAFGARGTSSIRADARELLGDAAFDALHEYVYHARARCTPDATVQRYFHKHYADNLQACFLVDQLVYHEMYPASEALC
eukprot:m.1305828 g.1305828  ORF g.1305828 m.1305828 type:complete len:874 (-) comp24814_c0_seq1:2776-5397(-)